MMGRRWTYDPQTMWRLHRHVAQWRPDIIHAWTSPAGWYGHVAARLGGIGRLIVTQPEVGPWTGCLGRAADQRLTRHCLCTIVHGDQDRDAWHRSGQSGAVAVIREGVAAHDRVAVTRREVLHQLELPEGVRLIGLIGRMTLPSRIQDAVWAADLLKVIRSDVHLMVVGDGPRRDCLRQFRDSVLIRDKVHFLGERSDAADLLSCCDVFWSTYASAGSRVSILEAMAAGIPVVASDRPETRELITPGETGYLYPVGDRAGIARYTERLLNDAPLAARLGEAGKQLIAREFSEATMVDRHAELYRRAMQCL
jgi:glycosyltransferase involved in cell wall biosynthesis